MGTLSFTRFTTAKNDLTKKAARASCSGGCTRCNSVYCTVASVPHLRESTSERNPHTRFLVFSRLHNVSNETFVVENEKSSRNLIPVVESLLNRAPGSPLLSFRDQVYGSSGHNLKINSMPIEGRLSTRQPAQALNEFRSKVITHNTIGTVYEILKSCPSKHQRLETRALYLLPLTGVINIT